MEAQRIWLNVQHVEKTFNPKKHGKWLVNPTNKENEPNSQSDYANAAAKLSEQHLARKKSKKSHEENILILFLQKFP